MSKILLQTTIQSDPDDWEVSRFALLADELLGLGHSVTARNRSDGADDPVLGHLDEYGFDQLWLMAVDTGDGLSAVECEAIARFRAKGGGVLTARDHQSLGCCLQQLGSLGVVNRFHDPAVDPIPMLDDIGTPDISWPNFHSGANGDYQPVLVDGRVHELLRTSMTDSGRIEWFPAHPHEGLVVADGSFATVVAQGRSATTGRRFNLAVALEEPDMGRAVAVSTFHHFADYNWDVGRGAPSFVTEPPGYEINDDPARLMVFKDYIRNIANWLTPSHPVRQLISLSDAVEGPDSGRPHGRPAVTG